MNVHQLAPTILKGTRTMAATAPDLSVKQLAEQIGMHPVNVSDLIRRGYFPNAYKAGRGTRNSPWRIPDADVTAYRAKQPRAAA